MDIAESPLPVRTELFRPGTSVENGQFFTFNMGTKRVNWNHAHWSILELEQPADLSAMSGIEVTLETQHPRSDAGVYLAVREESGAWYAHGWAAPLHLEKTQGVALFSDFAAAEYMAPAKGSWFDENQRLDLDRITALAVGVVNPHGIGVVDFTLTSLRFVKDESVPPDAVRIHVSGDLLNVNGTSMIPAGLFGAYNLPDGHTGKYRLAMDRIMHNDGLSGTPSKGDAVTHMLIECIGDRVRPSNRLTHPDWEARNIEHGKTFAEAALATGFQTYVEYWNEPYLNWSNVNRANFNPAFFDTSLVQEGGEVRIKHDGEIAPHLRWTKNYDAPPWQWTSRANWRRGRDERGRTFSVHAPPYKFMEWVYGGKWEPGTHPPENIADGEKFMARIGDNEMELRAFTPWHIYDETQFTFWSGKGQLKFYIEPMLAFGRSLKAVDPDAVFIAGWGFRPGEDHWDAFRMLYQPTIDAGIDIIDGICDHDYGGSPERMAANYEVVTAYGMSQHGKWLHSYNTETAMASDPQAYPEAEVSGGARADRNKFQWTSAKLLHALHYVPDKARAFAWFGYGGSWFSDGGEGVALTLLKNLRGRLLHVQTSDPLVHAVAAIDGTDPLNPRPPDMPDRIEMVLAVINTDTRAREVEIELSPPHGSTALECILRSVTMDEADQNLVILEETIPLSPTFRRTFAPGEVITLTLPLSNYEPGGSEIERNQYFGDAILADIHENTPLTQEIIIPKDQLSGVSKASIRFVAERLAEGEGMVNVNGKDYVLPRAVTPENTAFLRELVIDVEDLRPVNKLTFKVSSDQYAGYLLAMNSLILERKEKHAGSNGTN